MKWLRMFILSAGTILLMAALIRFLIACGNAQVLALPDPLLGIPLRLSVLLAGGLELLVACVCLFGKKVSLQIDWLCWLATNYLVFQIGLFWMQIHPQGTAIGTLGDPLRLTRGIPGAVAAWIPAYLILGTYAAVIWAWAVVPVLRRRQMKQAETQKMPCPSCGGHIAFSAKNEGQQWTCPHCLESIKLVPQTLLKISCYFCKEHIEFPAHAAGEKMPCPHCKREITLKLSAATAPV